MPDTTYADINELKVRIKVPLTVTTQDILLYNLLNVAARIVDAVTRQPPEGKEAFSTVEETRYFDDFGSGIIAIDDLYDIDPLELAPVHGVVLGDTTLLTTEYTLYPYNSRPYTQIRYNNNTPISYYHTGYLSGYGYGRAYPFSSVALRQVAITGDWGYCTEATRPSEVKEATLTQAERLFERFNIKITDIMAAMRDPYKSIDPTVLLMLQGLIKDRGVAVG